MGKRRRRTVSEEAGFTRFDEFQGLTDGELMLEAETAGYDAHEFYRGYRDAETAREAPTRRRRPPPDPEDLPMKPVPEGVPLRGEIARSRISLLAAVAYLDGDYSLATSHSQLGADVIRAAARFQRAVRRMCKAGELF